MYQCVEASSGDLLGLQLHFPLGYLSLCATVESVESGLTPGWTGIFSMQPKMEKRLFHSSLVPFSDSLHKFPPVRFEISSRNLEFPLSDLLPAELRVGINGQVFFFKYPECLILGGALCSRLIRTSEGAAAAAESRHICMPADSSVAPSGLG